MTQYATIPLCTDFFSIFGLSFHRMRQSQSQNDVVTIYFGNFFILVAVLHRLFLVGGLQSTIRRGERKKYTFTILHEWYFASSSSQ